VEGETVRIIKPHTYMNRSGAAVQHVERLKGFQVERDLLVLVDDVALPVGSFRIRRRGSPGGHNGLKSVSMYLGTEEYARLRIGVGPAPADRDDLSDYVLEEFESAEAETVKELTPTMAEAVECWLLEGVETAMNRYNRRGNQSE
jgi:PTH1 family peptidyl-tRNA hydrolase